jgi:hypothetical protein
MVIKKIKLNQLETKIIIQTLQFGSLTLIGQALRGSNSTFLTELKGKDQTLLAIYKPSKGERPLWDFPDFTLAQREVAAFVVSTLLGWELVPPTIFRIQPAVYGKGSLQYFIEHNPINHYFQPPIFNQTIFMKIAIFDLLINNADRKSGHVIFDSMNKPWLIDHGLCFNIEFKHRSVIWDFAGNQIPNELKNDIQKIVQVLELNELRLVRKLNMLLSKKEVFSIIERGKYLLYQGEFPYPEPNRRSYPWPPI